MALKPTIYKFRISISDMNRNHYDSSSVTLALHPSENLSRMMSRVLAFCLNHQTELSFTKGLSTTEEPDIWHKGHDGSIHEWIEVGEPDPERIKKATRLADKTLVYSFNKKSDIWWTQNQPKLNLLDVSVYRFSSDAIEELASLVNRTMDMSVMISGNSVFVSTDSGNCEVEVERLKGN